MKKAIVIGASSGIGRELSKILSRNRYIVGVMARRVHLLGELRDEVGGELFVERIDVEDIDVAKESLAKLIERMGGVDLIVIGAGTGRLNPRLDWAIELEIIKTNIIGFAAIANAAIKYFMEKGRGHLVGISSIAALRGGRPTPAYNASKAFDSNYLEGLRQKVAHAKLPIAVTDIKPGFVKTAMVKGDGVFWAADLEKAATQIYGAIKRKKSNAYITRRWALVAWLLKALPGFIHEKL